MGAWGRTALGMAMGVSLLIATSVPAGAQATRTWVSGVGDDANPCSRTAPCKTFAGAISNTAAGGEISVLDNGSFGVLDITKSLTIEATGVTAGVVAAGGGDGIEINAGPNDVVVLRGLTIESSGGGRGIVFGTGRALFVEETTINGFSSHGIDFAPTATSELYVARTTITNSGGSAIRATSASGQALVTVTDTQLVDNGVGLDVRSNARAAVVDSTATGNSVAAFRAQPDAGTAELLVEGATIAGNGIGALAGGGASSGAAIIRLSNVFVTQNETGIATASGNPLWSIVSFGNNRIFGNATDGVPTATGLHQ